MPAGSSGGVTAPVKVNPAGQCWGGAGSGPPGRTVGMLHLHPAGLFFIPLPIRLLVFFFNVGFSQKKLCLQSSALIPVVFTACLSVLLFLSRGIHLVDSLLHVLPLPCLCSLCPSPPPAQAWVIISCKPQVLRAFLHV